MWKITVIMYVVSIIVYIIGAILVRGMSDSEKTAFEQNNIVPKRIGAVLNILALCFILSSISTIIAIILELAILCG